MAPRLVGRPPDGPDHGRRRGQGPALPVHRRPARARLGRRCGRAPRRLPGAGRRPRPPVARRGRRRRARRLAPRRDPGQAGAGRLRAHGAAVHRGGDAGRGEPDGARPPPPRGGVHGRPAGRGRHQRGRGRGVPRHMHPPDRGARRPVERRARGPSDRSRRPRADPEGQPVAQAHEPDDPTSTRSTPRAHPPASSTASARSSAPPGGPGRSSTSTWSSTSTRT